MADINNVSGKILEDAGKEKEQILKSAKEKAEAILNDAKAEKAVILKEAEEAAKKRYDEVLQMEILKAESEYSRKLLAKKLDMLDQVMDDAVKSLSSMNDKDFASFLENALKNIDAKDGEFIIGSTEKRTDAKAVKAAAKKAGISLSESKTKPDFEHGIKIVSNRAEYNISPEAVFSNDIDDIKMDISKLLYPKGE